MNIADYALHFIGTRYVWGGNTPEQGFDCSGFVCECLRSIGKLDKRDLTAHGIYTHLLSEGGYSPDKIGKGSIIFYGSGNKITHVAIGINNKQVVEAGGEGRKESDKGFVRIRPWDYRSDIISILDFY